MCAKTGGCLYHLCQLLGQPHQTSYVNAPPQWRDRLTEKYGSPRTSGVASTIFEGPFCQYKGRGGRPGPITIVLYEDPQDKVPKLHVRCANYMAWIQEQRMPLHLHVQKDKKIMFDQVRKVLIVLESGRIKLKGQRTEGS